VPAERVLVFWDSMHEHGVTPTDLLARMRLAIFSKNQMIDMLQLCIDDLKKRGITLTVSDHQTIVCMLDTLYTIHYTHYTLHATIDIQGCHPCQCACVIGCWINAHRPAEALQAYSNLEAAVLTDTDSDTDDTVLH
jgi:hypothetical protein